VEWQQLERELVEWQLVVRQQLERELVEWQLVVRKQLERELVERQLVVRQQLEHGGLVLERPAGGYPDAVTGHSLVLPG
jgi:hypothetical protein